MGEYAGEGKVNLKGAVVIPAPLRKEYNIKTGDKIAFVINDDGSVTLKRSKPSYNDL